jgi:hypothetical protein
MILKKTRSSRSWSSKKSKNLFSPAGIGCIILFTSILLSACGEQDARIEDTYFIPPTLAPQAAPVVLETPTEDLLTPTPECTNILSFVEDVTVPDGTAFAPNATIDKRWLVKNEGTCNWDSGYRIKMVSGVEMDADTEQALYPARSDSEAEIRVVFTAPEIPDRYQSSWQAFDSNDVPFGDLFFIDIIVDDSLEIEPTPFSEEEGDQTE